jgi:surface antigen
MRSKLMTLMVGASLITGAGCATKSGTGAAVGAVGGGLIGGAVGGSTGLLVGAVAGGLLGFAAGKSLEEEDRRRMAYAFETGQPTRWRNPNTGYAYEVDPMDTRVEGSRECREFRMLAESGSRPEEIYGTACRQPDGSWQLVNG